MLVRAGLATDEIETLWQMSIGGGFPFGRDGATPSGSAMLDTIVSVCKRHGGEGSTELLEAGFVVDQRDEVTAEIEALRVGLERKAGSGAADLLLTCADNASPDVAFRFLLQIARNQFVWLDAEQYQRFHEIGRKLRYEPLVVEALDFLVEE